MTAYLIKGFYGNLPVILMSVTVILLAGILIYVLVRLHREYDMLDKMLDSAIEGNFQEKRFDEYMLSRLESKLYQFLSSSSLGRKKVEEERGKVEELIANISTRLKHPSPPYVCTRACLRKKICRRKNICWPDGLRSRMTEWHFSLKTW